MSVRTLIGTTPFYDYQADCLIKHDEFISKVQTLLKESLDTLHSYKVVYETEQLPQQINEQTSEFINMSDARVSHLMEKIFESARLEIDRRCVYGIINNEWLNDFLGIYREQLIQIENLSSEFNQSQYAQIVDIALGRISIVYLKEAA